MANTKHKDRFFRGTGAMRLLEDHYDDLPDSERREMVMDLIFATRELMMLRNIINMAVDHEKPVSECAQEIIE